MAKSAKKTPPKPVVLPQPRLYTDEMAELICDRIAAGESLRTICDDPDLPNRRTILRWLDDPNLVRFAAKYARAREAQGDAMDDKILAVADASTPETAAADRIKIDAYKWRASKLAPKKYGDKTAVEHSGTIGLEHWVLDSMGPVKSGGDA